MTEHHQDPPWEPQVWQHDAWEQDPDWDLHSAADDSPEQLYALWDAVGELVSVRRVVCDLIEEYGRHTGHADLIRESVDGLTGEDPPGDWRPIAPSRGVTGGA